MGELTVQNEANIESTENEKFMLVSERIRLRQELKEVERELYDLGDGELFNRTMEEKGVILNQLFAVEHILKELGIIG